jgi:outer membrane murein-binding lipoprotein Lpp
MLQKLMIVIGVILAAAYVANAQDNSNIRATRPAEHEAMVRDARISQLQSQIQSLLYRIDKLESEVNMQAIEILDLRRDKLDTPRRSGR